MVALGNPGAARDRHGLRAALAPIVERVAAQWQCGCTVFLSRSDDPELFECTAVGHPDAEFRELAELIFGHDPLSVREPSITRAVFETRRPVCIAHCEPHELKAQAKREYQILADPFGAYSVAVAPVLLDGEVQGTISVFSTDPHLHFGDQHVAQLERLAQEVARLAGPERTAVVEVQG